MSKRECDIIKDLLPSYVDEICSEASKEWIEEHLASCEECKATEEMLKHTEISSKRLEQEGFDAAKKLKRQEQRRMLLGFGLSLVMCLLLVLSFFWDNGQIPILALPVCMAAAWVVMLCQPKRRAWDRADLLCLLFTLVATGYGVFLMWYGFFHAAAGQTTFGRIPSETGPLLFSNLAGAAVFICVMFLFQIRRGVSQGKAGSVLQNLFLTEIFLLLSYCMQLRQLSSWDMALANLKTVTAVVLVLGVVGTAVFAVLDKLTKK